MEFPISKRLFEYWHEHCYATLVSHQLGLRFLDNIGIDYVRWSSDHPH